MNEYIIKAQESASRALHEAKALIGDFLPESVLESIAQQENLPIIAILSILALFIGFKIFKTIGLVIALIAVIAVSAGFVLN